MIFIDANAFYSYYGRSKIRMNSSPVDEKALRHFLDGKNEKSLPTSAFIEIVTHFRDNPKLLKKLIEFRKEKCLHLYNNIPDYIISPDEITVVGLMNEDELGSYSRRILAKKIEIETKFTYLFYEITRDLYLHYKLDDNSVLADDQKDKVLVYLISDGHKERAIEVEKRIRSTLEDGYANHDEKNMHKNLYIKELNEACLMIDIMISGFSSVVKQCTDIVSDIQRTYQEMLNRGLDGFNGTMPVIVDTLAKDTSFLEQAKNKISEMFEKGKYLPTQRRYIKDVMFRAWFDRGQKLQKNDIFDMLCVGCLDYIDNSKVENVLIDKTSYVVSFDKRMRSFLGSVRPWNERIIDSIKANQVR